MLLNAGMAADGGKFNRLKKQFRRGLETIYKYALGEDFSDSESDESDSEES